jgi:hypothetical protein
MLIEQSGAPTAESPTAEQAGAESATDANPAVSSPADEKDAKPAPSLLDVVRDAVKPEDQAAAAPSAAEGEGEAPTAEAQPKVETPEAQEEADRKLPFHEHPRWKEVLAERDGYREDATSYREITGFMQKHGLTGDEVTEGFDIMAKLKSGSPEGLSEAREYFASRLAMLDGALGNVLPDDLQTRVDNGEIDDAAARELAQLRATNQLRETRDTQSAEAAEADRVRREAHANAQACASAVDQWEVETKQADPDYAKKADLVLMASQAIVQETGKPPRNPAEARALVEQAYERVNKTLKGALPTPKPVKPAPKGSSATVETQPKSLLDAVRASLQR